MHKCIYIADPDTFLMCGFGWGFFFVVGFWVLFVLCFPPPT